MRGAQLVVVLACFVLALVGCRAPTEIEVTVTTDLACTKGATPYVTNTAIFAGGAAPGDATAPTALSYTCNPAGNIAYLGELVLVPNGSESATVDVEVRTGVNGTLAEDCDTNPQACIVERRQWSFSPHDPTPATIFMAQSCIGQPCLPGSTCYNAGCVPVSACPVSGCEPDASLIVPDAAFEAGDAGGDADTGAPADTSADTADAGDATTADSTTPDAPTDTTAGEETSVDAGSDSSATDAGQEASADSAADSGDTSMGAGGDSAADSSAGDSGADVGDAGDADAPPATTYAVGVVVSGLTTGTLVLVDSANDSLTLTASGTDYFATRLAQGAPYSVMVTTQPVGETCSVGNPITVGAGSTTITVTCSETSYSITGTVMGLNAGTAVALADGAGGTDSPSGSGSFGFSQQVANLASYNVTIVTQPVGQTCTVSNGSGIVNGADVTNVTVSCMANPIVTIGGTLSGLAASDSLTLLNNGTNPLILMANGSFMFTTSVAVGSPYSVTVSLQPTNPAETCAVMNGAGNATTTVTNVIVTCTTTSYTIGGNATGLTGTLNLLDNGIDPLSVTANGPFSFTVTLPSGSAYSVTVQTPPPGQSCNVVAGTGTVGSANVSNVSVTCSGSASNNVATGIAAGASHTCAVVNAGSVECWGDNGYDQLGNPSAGGSSDLPLPVKGLGVVTQLAAGTDFTCGLTGGEVFCWGDNTFGELGPTAHGIPMSITPVNIGLTTVQSIAAGGGHACAVVQGNVLCWGDNAYGELGGGSIGGTSSDPVQVMNLAGAVSLGLGADQSCSTVAGDDTIHCWGNNVDGQLGDGVMGSPSPIPVTVMLLPGAMHVSGGGTFGTVTGTSSGGFTCTVTSSAASCWGYNHDGELGDGNSTTVPTPMTVVSFTNPSQIAAGGTHTCAITQASPNNTYCWGNNAQGQLGAPPMTMSGSMTPTAVPIPVAKASTQITSGYDHSCALLTTGQVYCWGANNLGQLGNGSQVVAVGPVLVSL